MARKSDPQPLDPARCGLSFASFPATERRALLRLVGKRFSSEPTAADVLAIDVTSAAGTRGIGRVTLAGFIEAQERVRTELLRGVTGPPSALVSLGTPPPTWFAADQRLLADLDPWLDALDERAGPVARARFGIGVPRQTLHGIATGLGVTRERIRQIEAVGVWLLAHAQRQDRGALAERLRSAPEERLPVWLPRLRARFSDDIGFWRYVEIAAGLPETGHRAATPLTTRYVEMVAQPFWATRTGPQPLDALVRHLAETIEAPPVVVERAARGIAASLGWLGADDRLRPRNLWRSVAIAHVLWPEPGGLRGQEIEERILSLDLLPLELQGLPPSRRPPSPWAQPVGRNTYRHIARVPVDDAELERIAREALAVLLRAGQPLHLEVIWKEVAPRHDYWDVRWAISQRCSRLGYWFQGASLRDTISVVPTDRGVGLTGVVAAILERSGRPMTLEEVRAETNGRHVEVVFRALVQLRRAGLITRDAARRWGSSKEQVDRSPNSSALVE